MARSEGVLSRRRIWTVRLILLTDVFVFVAGLVSGIGLSPLLFSLSFGGVGTFVGTCKDFTRPQLRQISGLRAR